MAGRSGREISAEINHTGDRLAREILIAYPQGLFPMARFAEDESYEWFRPLRRGIIPLDKFHASKSLRRFARQKADHLEIRLNDDFEGIMRHSAAREETWINAPIIRAFCLLHASKLAHSLAIYHNGQLTGGIYGLALGGAFFGESMFSHAVNGSKLALWALTAMLGRAGFTLFDTQYLTPHLASLGGVEISASAYETLLGNALEKQAKKIEVFAPWEA